MFHLIFFFLLYFLPSLIGRDKKDALGIFLVNFLLGWTLIGWVGALVWAFTNPSPTAMAAKQSACSPGRTAPLSLLRRSDRPSSEDLPLLREGTSDGLGYHLA